jgi:NADP-dependent 3-hydroxy acid dehydrogenase YdfG
LILFSALLPGVIERSYGHIVNIAPFAGKDDNLNEWAYGSRQAASYQLRDTALAQIELRITGEHVQYMLSKNPMNPLH